jgi:hypothetical protein
MAAAKAVLDFDEFVEVLRERLFDADALFPGRIHSFMELMPDYADVTPTIWYRQAYEELDAQGHIGIEANTMGFDCHACLSADGRLFVRQSRGG